MKMRHWLIAGLVMAIVTAIATIDRFVQFEEVTPPVVADVGMPVAGQWVCPMVDGDEATSAQVLVARGLTDDDDTLATPVSIGSLRDGARQVRDRPGPVPGSFATFEAAAPTLVAWADQPVGVFREWWFEGGDLPAGIVSGGCVSAMSDRWTIPGLRTSGGAEARIRVTNPFRTDATVAARFTTPEGPAEPLALQNLSVPARSTIEIVVNESLPERDDLAAMIDVHTGRVVVEGVQLVRSAIGGVDGVALLQAAPQAAESWTVPWLVDGPDRSSWLWVVNPDQRTAAVELTFHTAGGGVVADGFDEVLIEPGTMRRIDLRGAFPDGTQVAAVTARVSGASIVVSGAVEVDHAEPARTGIAVQLGAVRTDAMWMLTGGDATDRDEQAHLVNPTSVDAIVSVTLRTNQGVRRPPSLQGLAVPAGSAVPVDLTAHLGEDVEAWTAFIVVEEGAVIAGRVGGSRVDSRRLVASTGVSSAAWMPDGPALASVQAPGMTQLLGTDLGMRPPDPFAMPPRRDAVEADEPFVDGGGGLQPSVVAPMPSVPGDGASDDDPVDDDDEEGNGDAAD